MARILISVDHKWRDLPGYVYCQKLLERNGHTVRLVRNGLEKYYIPVFRPEVVVMIHLYEAHMQEYARRLSNEGVSVVLLPTEGIPTLEGYRRFAGGVDCDLSGVALQFAWNKPMAEVLGENSTISEERVKVIGSPRFDFYSERLRGCLTSKKAFCRKYKLDPEKKIVTFATNFTQAQFATTNKEFFLDDSLRLGYRSVLEEMFGDAASVPERDFQSREINCAAFCSLVRDLPHVNFLLKLHPSEDHQYYYTMLEKTLGSELDRVRVLANEYIWDVLFLSDVELKRSCTTGIESWILGKPTIEMNLHPDEWYFSPEHASGSYIAGDYESLRQGLTHYLGGSAVDTELLEARRKFLNKWCYKTDGRSTFRLVEELQKLIDARNGTVRIKPTFKDHLMVGLLNIGDNFIHDVRVYGLRNLFRNRMVDRLGRSDKYFHESDVAHWSQKLDALLSSV